MHSLSLSRVTKTYHSPKKPPFTAVDDVTFSVAPGKIHGLLGPNGAGKSTIIAMITGMTTPTAGSITLFEHDVLKEPNATKALLGIVPQETVVEMAFTVFEVLYYFCGMYGVPVADREGRIDAVLADLDLSEKKHEKAKSLSGGMKRRLMIAKAILHKPKFLILDEPTAGVDVALRQKIWELVRRLNKEGTTILFTTHYLEEAEQLCETITVLNKGVIVKEGTVKDIQKEFSRNAVHFTLYNSTVPHLPHVTSVGTGFSLPMTRLDADLAALSTHYGDNLKEVKSEAASLEQIFLSLTQ